MSFLTPIPMLVAAGLAVPSLLALYFLKLRRRPVRVSSTMLWEDAARDLEVNVPLRWIRSSWLLWLHLLILALLILALGRPTLDTGGARPARLVLVIDRSASMGALVDGERTRLDEARGRAIELAEDATGRGLEVAVVAFDSRATMPGAASTSAGELRRQIDGLTGSDRPGDLRAAFELAQTLVVRPDEEDEASVPTSVVVLSDGGDAPRVSLTLAGAEVRYEAIGGPVTDNVGLVSLSAQRDRSDPALVRVFLRLINTGAGEVAVPLEVSSVPSSAPAEPPATVRRLALAVPGADASGPGEQTRTLELRLPEAQALVIRITRGDDLGADDFAGVLLPPALGPSVLHVCREGEGGPLPSPMLSDVLEALGPRVVRRVNLGTYERNASSPGDADVIVFDGVAPDAPPVRPSLTFGASPGFLGGDGGELAGTVGVLRWDRSHPSLRDVALESLVVGGRVRLPDRGGAGVESLRVLIAGPEHPLAVEARAGGLSHVVVAFRPERSNWPLQVGFSIFVAQTLEWLAPIGGGAPGRVFTTGEALTLRSAGGTDGEAVVLTGPADLSAVARAGVASLGVPERAGLYRASGAGTSLVPVSLLDAGESSLRVAPGLSVAGRTLASTTESTLGPTEIWRWLVLAALVLLAADWLLYGMQMRPAPAPDWGGGTIGPGDRS
ncbi:MAG: BatA domain-containing protein [Phycisphaerales bacterium JB040]